MGKKIQTKRIILATLSLVLCLSLLIATRPQQAKAQPNPQPNLALKVDIYNYCRKVALGYTGNPAKESDPNIEAQIDQSGVMPSPCAQGYLAGFFGNKSKAAACNPNEVTNPGENPFFPSPGEGPDPISSRDKRLCRDAYDKGKGEQTRAINDASQVADGVCNKTERSKREQCRRDLNACRNKPASQKLACFQKLATDYPQAAAGGTEENPDNCEQGGFGLTWIICPIIDFGQSVSEEVFGSFLQPLLKDVPISATPGDKGYGGYQAWQSFRILANIVLVGAMLLLVYGMIRGQR